MDLEKNTAKTVETQNGYDMYLEDIENAANVSEVKKLSFIDIITIQSILCIIIVIAMLVYNIINPGNTEKLKQNIDENIAAADKYSEKIYGLGEQLFELITKQPEQNGGAETDNRKNGGSGFVEADVAEPATAADTTSRSDSLDPVIQTLGYNCSVPVYGYVTSGFGSRINPINGIDEFHDGIDIACDEGTPIHAFTGGTVLISAYDYTAGNYIVIEDENGIKTRYLHCLHSIVDAGDTVKAGDPIGMVGSTGSSTAPHLHFEIIKSDVNLDPAYVLNALQLEFDGVHND